MSTLLLSLRLLLLAGDLLSALPCPVVSTALSSLLPLLIPLPSSILCTLLSSYCCSAYAAVRSIYFISLKGAKSHSIYAAFSISFSLALSPPLSLSLTHSFSIACSLRALPAAYPCAVFCFLFELNYNPCSPILILSLRPHLPLTFSWLVCSSPLPHSLLRSSLFCFLLSCIISTQANYFMCICAIYSLSSEPVLACMCSISSAASALPPALPSACPNALCKRFK